ncbi:MAG: hypothetical protein U0X73_13220 [Thermoanaerobaculia bacterium]
MRSRVRLLAAAALVAAWMTLLFTGHLLYGAAHLALVAALVALPWRAGGSRTPTPTEKP